VGLFETSPDASAASPQSPYRAAPAGAASVRSTPVAATDSPSSSSSSSLTASTSVSWSSFRPEPTPVPSSASFRSSAVAETPPSQTAAFRPRVLRFGPQTPLSVRVAQRQTPVEQVSGLTDDVQSFLESAWSAPRRQDVERVAQQFDEYARPLGFSLGNAPVAVLLEFLVETFRSTSSLSRPLAVASSLEQARARLGLPPMPAHALAQFRRAVRVQRPRVPRTLGVMPFAPYQLMPHLPWREDFFSTRLRALVLMRIVSLVRSGDAASISRKSIRVCVDPLGRRVVTFNYNSKSSNAARVAGDSNYVEFLSPAAAQRFVPRQYAHLASPAAALLDLKEWVEMTAASKAHDSLFTDGSGKPLTSSTLGSLVTKFLREVVRLDHAFTAHSLRGASNQLLQLLGVPVEDICLRAGWSSRSANAVRIEHYTRFRLVSGNFADLLLVPPGTIHVSAVSE